jgi:ribosome maturation factor RimP
LAVNKGISDSGGLQSPLSLIRKMVKSDIENIIEHYLADQPVFLVEVQVKKGNVVNVFIDSDKGVNIDDCVKITRLIESTYDRDIEDYELRVSSPGIERPFVMNRQYNKYLEREIAVITNAEIKKEGILKSISDEGIEMAVKMGKKEKEISLEKILFSDIKEAKAVISFKSN